MSMDALLMRHPNPCGRRPADAAPAATLHIMPFATLLTAVVAFLVGGALGWWPLAAWTQRSLKGELPNERMPLRTVRIAGAVITAVTFSALALRFGLTWIVPALLVFAASATVLTLVDLGEKRLPNAVIFPTLGVVALLLVPASWATGSWIAMLWAVIGSAAMFALYFLLALISPSSMGMGDVKLALVIGLLLGWFGLTAWLFALLAAFVVGGLVAIVALLMRRVTLRGSIPFGPSMLAGALIALLVVGS
jgi:leader peptidase (prepilin peptidase)/N-methyltransferase